MEDVIWNFPVQINKIKTNNCDYDPMEAYEILKKGRLMLSISLTYELSVAHTVFSAEGMEDLLSAVEKMVTQNICGLYVCEPYTVLIGCNDTTIFVIDTHPVGVEFGGCNTGLVVCSTRDSQGAEILCKWIWKRLYESGVDESNKQSFSVVLNEGNKYVMPRITYK